MNVAVIGTGYVGLTTGVALAYLGHAVAAVDKDERKVDLLTAGCCPIHEPGLEALLAQVAPRLSFSTDTVGAVAAADVILIAVGTPQQESGEADLRFVEAAIREVARALAPGQKCACVIKSTVPVGTNQRMYRILLDELAARDITADVTFAFNPEFLREGVALQDTFYPDRIVIGTEQADAMNALIHLYRPILEQTFVAPTLFPRADVARLPHLITTDAISAEIIKYAANAFLAVKISYINEIAGLCEKLGGDVVEVARGIGGDPRIGHRFLAAGLGWGGSCFPKDTAALLAMATAQDYTMPIIAAAREVNLRQRSATLDKLTTALGGLQGKCIGMLGLAFKPNTDDTRDAPALQLIRDLLAQGATVRAHDPVAMPHLRRETDLAAVTLVDDPYAVADSADAVVLATEWEAYRELNLARLAAVMRTPVLLDGRNLYSPEKVRAAGLRYLGVGR